MKPIEYKKGYAFISEDPGNNEQNNVNLTPILPSVDLCIQECKDNSNCME